jgi:hypothetical protein
MDVAWNKELNSDLPMTRDTGTSGYFLRMAAMESM